MKSFTILRSAAGALFSRPISFGNLSSDIFAGQSTSCRS